MKITNEIDCAKDFEFWSGALETIEELTENEVQTVWEILEMEQADCGIEYDETAINDIFWFERDWIANMLGYADFEEIIGKNALVKKLKAED